MKFLGWMHRKLTHNNIEEVKISTIGNPNFSVQSLSDELYYSVEPNKGLHPDIKCQKSPNKFEANEDALLFQETFEPFDFLAIGTFGMELMNTDPPTPTFPLPFENFDHAEITEKDLKQINYELEKFLEAEEEENDTSERSSQASIITLSSKPLEGTASEGHVYVIACPLQDYLFATPIELEETHKEVKKEKISLQELFKRTNAVHDDPTGKCQAVKKPRKKRNVSHFMKKVVKKLQSSSSGSTPPPKDRVPASISIKKKISQAIKKFYNKVHPEEMAENQFYKLKRERKHTSHENGDQQEDNAENKAICQVARKKTKRNNAQVSSNVINKDPSTMNDGHWIKTDSDYLVLEL